MESKQYIENKLTEIVDLFPELTFRYQYNQRNQTHIVETKPLEAYKNNGAYIKAESDLMFEFENRFLTETILFVSDESLTHVTAPCFTVCR